MTLAIVAHGARDLRLEPRPAGDPDPTQVRVALARGGICGSDLHYYAHGGFGTVRLREPMVLGHEISGHIAALGSEVVGLREGDLVALSPSRPCGGCVECLRGLPMHCLNMRFYGSAMPMPHIQGAFRQEIIADPAHLVRAEGISPAMAAMAEPLAVCLHAVERAGPVMGRRVLVTGCGPIGCLVILALRRAGAAEIIATDIADGALGFAKQAGADVVINAASDPDALAPYTVGKGTMDLAIECSGSAPALATTIAALRPRGTLVQLGLGGDMNVPLQALTAKELHLHGAFRFHDEFATAVRFMAQGLIDPGFLVTHEFAMETYEEAFATALDRTRAMKVQIRLGPC